ncbi:hypothetical protein SAMN05216577_12267 [Pseudomonas citronellolis]|uniref:Uncharacterized protein n=1 Tax=Pseudomonas citronellolis TaxID=53408 RepID=A0AAQ1HXM1_9PSED|nr:hypothetical protein SAMN05216577_12267 [Pseudomonas citronellolis]
MTPGSPAASNGPLSLRERAGVRVTDFTHTPLPTLTPLPHPNPPRKRERGPFGARRNHELPGSAISSCDPRAVVNGLRRTGQRRITANGYTPYDGNHRVARSTRMTLGFPAAPNGSLSLRERAGVRATDFAHTPLPILTPLPLPNPPPEGRGDRSARGRITKLPGSAISSCDPRAVVHGLQRTGRRRITANGYTPYGGNHHVARSSRITPASPAAPNGPSPFGRGLG